MSRMAISRVFTILFVAMLLAVVATQSSFSAPSRYPGIHDSLSLSLTYSSTPSGHLFSTPATQIHYRAGASVGSTGYGISGADLEAIAAWEQWWWSKYCQVKGVLLSLTSTTSSSYFDSAGTLMFLFLFLFFVGLWFLFYWGKCWGYPCWFSFKIRRRCSWSPSAWLLLEMFSNGIDESFSKGLFRIHCLNWMVFIDCS